jgi:hypothetical protein
LPTAQVDVGFFNCGDANFGEKLEVAADQFVAHIYIVTELAVF